MDLLLLLSCHEFKSNDRGSVYFGTTAAIEEPSMRVDGLIELVAEAVSALGPGFKRGNVCALNASLSLKLIV